MVTRALDYNGAKEEIVSEEKPRYFYHITPEDWGNEVTLKPRHVNLCCDEPVVARICVGPTVPHCLSAIPFDELEIGFFNIYRTAEKTISWFPVGVEDWTITRERWILDPATFKKVGTWIKPDNFPPQPDIPLGDGFIGHLNKQKKHLEKMIRYFKRHSPDKIAP